MALVVQQASLSDMPLISELAHLIWRSHYPAIIGHEQTEYMLAHFHNPEYLANQLTNEKHLYYLIKNDDTVVGFLSYHLNQAPDAFLNKFYILPDRQRSGAGHEALQLLEQALAGSNGLRLQVNRMNLKAINFYFKNGFQIEQVGDFDIGNGYFMNDFVMYKKLR